MRGRSTVSVVLEAAVCHHICIKAVLAALPVGSVSRHCDRREEGATENRRGHAIPSRSKWFETEEEVEGKRGVFHKTAT